MISPQFLEKCQSGDEESIRTLIRSYQRPVFQLALSILDDDTGQPDSVVQQAAEATRQTFMTALDRLNRFRDEIPFETWLYGIAIEVSKKRFRSYKRTQWLNRLFNRSPEPALDQDAASRDGDDPLWQAVRKLDLKYRLPVVLRYFHNMSTGEIARLLHLSEGTVHARLDAAREKIAGTIE